MSPDPSTGETRIRYECVKGAEVKTKAIIVPLEREGGREGGREFVGLLLTVVSSTIQESNQASGVHKAHYT